MIFKYRYVGFGTTFEARPGIRPSRDTAASWLYENEIALDVGGSCWGYDGENLSVIDHHFQRDRQFPSASAAVLSMAPQIAQKFAHQNSDVIWLVTHVQPDFDAFCSMYLVRCILENRILLDSKALIPVPDTFDWFHLSDEVVPVDSRWPFLLASYASHIDNGRRIVCPRQHAIHSLLYAALYRGRAYRSESSGATEFFDEVRQAIQKRQLNPLYDSVLEGSTHFQPELTLLAGEVEAYQRDVRRARKSIVYLQKLDRPFEDFFESVERNPLLNSEGDLVAPHLPDPSAERDQVDAIYLRDPECLLFKEWARMDTENSSLGDGFTFTAVAYSGGRPQGRVNQTDYFFALDPERANRRHLYGVWARLEAAEVQALHKPDHAPLKEQLEEAERAAEHTTRRTLCRLRFEDRAGDDKALFDDPWFDGNNYKSTIVVTPNRGTLIGSPGRRADLVDDPIVDIVRKELEHSVYISSLTMEDLGASYALQNTPVQDCEVGGKYQVPVEGYFRFAKVALNAGIDPFAGHIARQIGETLWQVLHPDSGGGVPTDFLTRHLVINSEWVGIWSRRGIVLAYKPNGKAKVESVESRFRQTISLSSRVEAFISPEQKPLDEIVESGENLTREAARLTHELTLPESRLLSRFFESLGLRELLTALRDLNLAAADKAMQVETNKHTETMSTHTETVASVQAKLEVLEVFIFTVYFAEMGHMLAEHASSAGQLAAIGGGALIGLFLGVLVLNPNVEDYARHWKKGSFFRKKEISSPSPDKLQISRPPAAPAKVLPAEAAPASSEAGREIPRAIVHYPASPPEEKQQTLSRRD